MSESPERKFIHDLLNPLAVAVGMLDRALADLQNTPDTPEKQKTLERLEKVKKSIAKTVELVRARREHLIQERAAAADPSKKQAA